LEYRTVPYNLYGTVRYSNTVVTSELLSLYGIKMSKNRNYLEDFWSLVVFLVEKFRKNFPVSFCDFFVKYYIRQIPPSIDDNVRIIFLFNSPVRYPSRYPI